MIVAAGLPARRAASRARYKSRIGPVGDECRPSQRLTLANETLKRRAICSWDSPSLRRIDRSCLEASIARVYARVQSLSTKVITSAIYKLGRVSARPLERRFSIFDRIEGLLGHDRDRSRAAALSPVRVADRRRSSRPGRDKIRWLGDKDMCNQTYLA